MEELDTAALQLMQYNAVIALIGGVALVITLIVSFKKGGIKEIGENLLLWFLLFFGIYFMASQPVAEDDQITGAILLIAFGICRMAKHLSRKI